ncbi:MAG TPA: hypothetical protein VGL86_10005 [Polyangia bacterium]
MALAVTQIDGLAEGIEASLAVLFLTLQLIDPSSAKIRTRIIRENGIKMSTMFSEASNGLACLDGSRPTTTYGLDARIIARE